ncbi:MAG: hypothetical protein LQ349_008063, partial [Xanthoria aureola]
MDVVSVDEFVILTAYKLLLESAFDAQERVGCVPHSNAGCEVHQGVHPGRWSEHFGSTARARVITRLQGLQAGVAITTAVGEAVSSGLLMFMSSIRVFGSWKLKEETGPGYILVN